MYLWQLSYWLTIPIILDNCYFQAKTMIRNFGRPSMTCCGETSKSSVGAALQVALLSFLFFELERLEKWRPWCCTVGVVKWIWQGDSVYFYWTMDFVLLSFIFSFIHLLFLFHFTFGIFFYILQVKDLFNFLFLSYIFQFKINSKLSSIHYPIRTRTNQKQNITSNRGKKNNLRRI